MTVLTSGSDKRVSAAKHYLDGWKQTADLSPETVILLPIPSFSDGEHITGGGQTAADLPATGACVAGYAIPDTVRALLLARGAAVIDVARDERFIEENARLTAVGTLAHLFSTDTRAPGDLSFGIIGYGRIGRELTRLLIAYGAQVRVYTSRKSVRLSLGSYGIAAGDSLSPDFSGVDVLINTAPAALIRSADLSDPPPRVIELASGKNIAEGVAFERLASVPAHFYPDSAGAAYARAVLRRLRTGAEGEMGGMEK